MLVFRLVSYDGERSAIDGCLKKPRDVPKCLSSQRTTCYFEGFSGRKVEMKLVRKILKVATVLKTENHC